MLFCCYGAGACKLTACLISLDLFHWWSCSGVHVSHNLLVYSKSDEGCRIESIHQINISVKMAHIRFFNSQLIFAIESAFYIKKIRIHRNMLFHLSQMAVKLGIWGPSVQCEMVMVVGRQGFLLSFSYVVRFWKVTGRALVGSCTTSPPQIFRHFF